MGYFANGSEGDGYFERYCAGCLHAQDERPCAVWALHEQFNYAQLKEQDKEERPLTSVLSALIPQDEKGHNMECSMYRPLRSVAAEGGAVVWCDCFREVIGLTDKLAGVPCAACAREAAAAR